MNLRRVLVNLATPIIFLRTFYRGKKMGKIEYKRVSTFVNEKADAFNINIRARGLARYSASQQKMIPSRGASTQVTTPKAATYGRTSTEEIVRAMFEELDNITLQEGIFDDAWAAAKGFTKDALEKIKKGWMELVAKIKQAIKKVIDIVTELFSQGIDVIMDFFGLEIIGMSAPMF